MCGARPCGQGVNHPRTFRCNGLAVISRFVLQALIVTNEVKVSPAGKCSLKVQELRTEPGHLFFSCSKAGSRTSWGLYLWLEVTGSF